MVGIITFFAVVVISLLITRVATIALSLTGLSRESARFQARSALSGAGFTTAESESVVNHPVRRRIIMMLILVGSAGLLTAVSTLAISFGGNSENRLLRASILIGALFVLFLISRSAIIDKGLSRVIERILRARGMDVRDYSSLMRLSGDYAIGEILVEEQDWVADRVLDELHLREEGIQVLGIERANGDYVGVPEGEARIVAGDTLILYAREAQLEDLDKRGDQEGPSAHEAAAERRRRERRRSEHEQAAQGERAED